MSDPVISIQGLVKRYGKIEALRGVTVTTSFNGKRLLKRLLALRQTQNRAIVEQVVELCCVEPAGYVTVGVEDVSEGAALLPADHGIALNDLVRVLSRQAGADQGDAVGRHGGSLGLGGGLV